MHFRTTTKLEKISDAIPQKQNKETKSGAQKNYKEIFIVGPKSSVTTFSQQILIANNIKQKKFNASSLSETMYGEKVINIVFQQLTSLSDFDPFLQKKITEKIAGNTLNLYFIFCFSFDDDLNSKDYISFAQCISFYQKLEQIISDDENSKHMITSLVIGINADKKSIIMTSARGQYLMESVKARAYIECYLDSKSDEQYYYNFDFALDTIKHFILNPKSEPRIYLATTESDILSDPVFQEFCMVFGPSVLRTYQASQGSINYSETFLQKKTTFKYNSIIISTLIKMFKVTSPEVKMALSRSSSSNRPITSAGGGLQFTMQSGHPVHYDFINRNPLLPRKSTINLDINEDSISEDSVIFEIYFDNDFDNISTVPKRQEMTVNDFERKILSSSRPNEQIHNFRSDDYDGDRSTRNVTPNPFSSRGENPFSSRRENPFSSRGENPFSSRRENPFPSNVRPTLFSSRLNFI